MIEWIKNITSSGGFNLMILPAMFILGIISAAGSFACSLPAIGLVAGYAGTSRGSGKRDSILLAAGFMLGAIISLTVVGYIIGYAGRIAGDIFSNYSKVLAGLVAVFFGIMTLDLIPFKLPQIKFTPKKSDPGVAGAVLVGFVTGGGVMACTLTCCSPVLPILFGVTGIQGNELKSAIMMAAFATGFSIPMAAVIMGISLGKWALRANRIIPAVRIVTGILLLIVGFFFLK